MSLRRQRIAGVLLLVGIALAIVLGVTKPNPFADRQVYWAEFDTASGLGAIDRDVRIAGVKVGDVGEVKRVGDDVRVELRLTGNHVLKQDARAAMRPHTLFEGSNYIDLEPGSPGAPVLNEGGTIPRRQTTNYVTLDRALRVLRPDIRDNLRKLAKDGSLTLRGGAIEGIQRTLKGGPALTRALAPAARAAQGPHRRELVGAIRGLARTSEALSSERDELLPLTRGIDRTMQALAVDGGRPLDAALQELPTTLAALEQDAPAVDDVIGRLTTFASRLGTQTPRAVARALRGTTPVLTRARPVLRDGTPLVRNARLVGGRLAAARGGLVKLFDVLKDPLTTFPDVLEALNAKSSLGASSGAFQLVAGGFEGLDGAVAGYRTKSQSPNQPGHQLRANIRIEPAALQGLQSTLTDLLPASSARTTTAQPASCALVAKFSQAAVDAVRRAGACR